MARILVVDDEADARMMLGKLLAIAGHEVAFASNGWEALLTIDNMKIDLVLLDLLMPGMNGETFLRIMREGERHRDLPVVIVTAISKENAEQKVKDLRVQGVLCKGQSLIDGIMRILHDHLGDTIAGAFEDPTDVIPKLNGGG